MNDAITRALTNFLPLVLPEAVLGVVACLMFLGATWRGGRRLWGGAALVGLGLAAAALVYTAVAVPTIQTMQERLDDIPRLQREIREEKNLPPGKAEAEIKDLDAEAKDLAPKVNAQRYASPVVNSRLALFLKALALAGAVILVLTSWNEVSDALAAEYHACLLLMTAGLCLTGAANELITLFLSLELISIPTYILLYLPRGDERAQESAMKYFLLSIFSSALLLFGFSYLYGTAGTTNLTALGDAVMRPGAEAGAAGLVLTAVLLVTAGLGFRITAVPFHFYAPDVYEGTTPSAAAILAFVPKVAGFAVLLRVFGFNFGLPADGYLIPGRIMDGQGLKLLWILAAATMTLGNVLALLQNDLKRLMAYSSVAHAGYMLAALAAAAPLLPSESARPLGAEAVVFYLVAYGAMTVGAFALLAHLNGPRRRVETVDDLAGLSVTHPGAALLMVLFLFSLIGIPLTVGFWAKWQVFLSVLYLPSNADSLSVLWFIVLAVVTAVNAAVGGWYYLRIAAVMYLRPGLSTPERPRFGPALLAVWLCALITLAFGLYPRPLQQWVQASLPRPAVSAPSNQSAVAAPAP